jgi:hypothetical protein
MSNTIGNASNEPIRECDKNVVALIPNEVVISRPTDIAAAAAHYAQIGIARHTTSSVKLQKIMADFPPDTYREKGATDTNVFEIASNKMLCLQPFQFNELTKALDVCRQAGLICHIAERQGTLHTPNSGIMFDFDVDLASPNNLNYTSKHRRKIVNLILSTIRPTINIVDGKLSTYVFITEKPDIVAKITNTGTATAQTIYRFGFHVLIPGIQITRNHKKFILNELASNNLLLRELKDIGAIDPLKVIDMLSASVPPMLLGSAKAGKTVCYQLKAAYEAELCTDDDYIDINEIPMDKLIQKQYNLVAELSLTHQATYDDETIPLVTMRICAPNHAYEERVLDIGLRTQGSIIDIADLISVDNSVNALTIADPEALYIHHVLDLLPPDYSADYGKWINVIFALANTDQRYFPLAKWFSQKCPQKQSVGELERIWQDAVTTGGTCGTKLTTRSIFYWARENNREKFKAISEQSYSALFNKYVFDSDGKMGHYTTAKILRVMLADKFCVAYDETVLKGNPYMWYELVLPGDDAKCGRVWKWRCEHTPTTLLTYISETYKKLFDSLLADIRERRKSSEDVDRITYYKLVEKNLTISKNDCDMRPFKSSVAIEAQQVFLKRGFLDNLDATTDVIGVGNGLLKLGAKCELIDYPNEYYVILL